ncbi:MAG TPA: alcohol dehydrogenase catalytic domain-containing protein [Acidimicrobiales bacterium]|jgi:2-desacetyl-2-hydroxyethyl bacteriochlorophyllide A dehydrogenase|nr:alcohol dehydrogenase catalytic domain-containing protein [Acidimicrobiales bacterium]
MRATVLQGPRDVRVVQVPDPVLPGPAGVIVTVERTAICGSDLHLYHDAPTGPGIQLGHEAIGTVAEIGPDVHTVRVGDRVLVSGVIGCGMCRPCLAGQPNLCQAGKAAAFGTMLDLPGGQSEAMAVPFADSFVLPVPDGIADEEAVLLTDILPTGYVGALRADIAPGSTVVVVGLGPVGIMALQCAQLFGPARILAVDMVPERLARAERLGAEPIDARQAPGSLQVLEATQGRGAESVIEAVGADATVLDAVACAALGGTVSIVGVNLEMALPFPMALVFLKSLTVRAVFAPVPGTWPALVPLVQSGRFTLTETFTHHMGLSQAAEAYELFDSRTDGVLKVLLDPNS